MRCRVLPVTLLELGFTEMVAVKSAAVSRLVMRLLPETSTSTVL